MGWGWWGGGGGGVCKVPPVVGFWQFGTRNFPVKIKDGMVCYGMVWYDKKKAIIFLSNIYFNLSSSNNMIRNA